MKVEHLALWTRDVERLRAFYERWFGVRASGRYESATTPGFASYFLTFPDGGARLELMQLPALNPLPPAHAMGYAHLAVSVGSPDNVDAMEARMRDAGVTIRSGARFTGDGYYEAVVDDPDGNPIEITS